MATRTPLCSPLLPLSSLCPPSSLFPLPSVRCPLSSLLARAPPYLPKGGTYYVLRTTYFFGRPTRYQRRPKQKCTTVQEGRKGTRGAAQGASQGPCKPGARSAGAPRRKEEGRQNTKTCPPVGQKKKIRSTISIMSVVRTYVCTYVRTYILIST